MTLYKIDSDHGSAYVTAEDINLAIFKFIDKQVKDGQTNFKKDWIQTVEKISSEETGTLIC